MSVEEVAGREVDIEVRNIGGIERTSVTFEPGVNVLAGRNATNRTSLLQAIMAGLGSDNVSTKSDAGEASVEMTIGESRYTRTFEQQNGTIVADGDPYLEDPTRADLFAFLLESNETRRAVVTDADLRELIMRPIDIDEIQDEIERLMDERREIDAELEEVDSLKDRLPALEEERAGLEERIEELNAEVETLEDEIETRDVDIEQNRAEKAELDEKLAEIRSLRSDLEDVRYAVETERDSLESLREERAELDAEYEELPEAPVGETEEIESRVDELRERKRRLETETNELQSLVRFNEERLSEVEGDLLDPLDDGTEPVADQLLPSETVTCWTCGSEVDADRIESTVQKLREFSQSKLATINEIGEELEELKGRRRDIREKREHRERIERRRAEIDDEIEATRANIEELSERRETLEAELGAVETEVEALESDVQRELLDLHREINQLEYELGKVESDRQRVDEEIEEIEARIAEESALEARLAELNDEIRELRTRIERIERQAIEGFNEHMGTVIELLEYENLERVWLERFETERKEGRRTVTRSVFELHVVRSNDSEATYEDTVDNLSESERKVIGLVFALAGYLAHEVYETVPFILLDSLEAIDSERIATLVDYVSEFSPYLVVALLSEDAAALDDEYRYIKDI